MDSSTAYDYDSPNNSFLSDVAVCVVQHQLSFSPKEWTNQQPIIKQSYIPTQDAKPWIINWRSYGSDLQGIGSCLLNMAIVIWGQQCALFYYSLITISVETELCKHQECISPTFSSSFQDLPPSPWLKVSYTYTQSSPYFEKLDIYYLEY